MKNRKKEKKAQYHMPYKKDFLHVFFGYELFDGNADEAQKMADILNLFRTDDSVFICGFFVDKDQSFLNELEKDVGREADILFTRKKFFSKSEYRKMSISFNGQLLSKIVELAIDHGGSVDIDCRDEEAVSVGAYFNDNEGHGIYFSTSEYDVKHIRTEIGRILNA